MAAGGISAGAAFIEVLPVTGKFGSELNRQIDPQLKKTEAGLSRFKGVATLAFAAAGVAVVKFAASSVTAYRESEAATAALQNVISKSPKLIGETTAAFQKQATQLQNTTGYQDEFILSADTVLARFDLTGDKIREVVPLVLDYARATGREVPAAAEAVGKAVLGNTKALKEIGIQYTVTGDKAKDTANIMALLEAKVGGAAKAFGETSQGKMEIFAAKLDDIQEIVGEALIPVLDGLFTALSALLPVIVPLLGHIAVLGAGFLAFKALTFLPALLFNVAKGLEVIGASGAANALLNAAGGAEAFGLALKSILPGLGVLAVLGFELVKSYGQQQQTIASLSQTIVKYGSDSKQGAIAVEQLGQATARVGDRSSIANRYSKEFQDTIVGLDAAHGRLKVSIDGAVAALEKETGASKRTTDALLAQRGATDALAGGILGLVSSARSAHDANLDLAAAQKQVNEDIAKGKTGTKDYAEHLRDLRDAQFNALQGQLSFHSALTSYAQTLRGPVAKAQADLIAATNKETNAKYTVEQKTLDVAAATKALTDAQHGLAPAQQRAIALLRDMGAKAGLTRAQVDALIGKVLGLAGSIDKVPRFHRTNVTAPGLDNVLSMFQSLYGVIYKIKRLGGIQIPVGGGAGVMAEGGAFAGYASGAFFGSPGGHIFQAGEGNYPTPLARGAELVSNQGVLPLSDEMIGRLGHAIAMAGGSSSGTAGMKQAFKEALWEMRGVLAHGHPLLMNRREIGLAVADQALAER